MRKFQTRAVPLGKIYLDNDNARHDRIENEPETIAHLIGHEQIKSLAAHIAKMNSTSPLDILGVVPHRIVKNAYTTAEGNRRLCALKLLNDPDKAPEGHRTYFRKLAESMEAPPKEITVVLFKDMAEARPWVRLRHRGAQQGVGIRAWNTRQQAKHDAAEASPNHPDALAVKLLDYSKKRGLISAKQHGEINVTTLTRYLTNPLVRDALGLASNRNLEIHAPQEEVDRAVGRFLKDAHIGKDAGVHSRTNAKMRAAYVHKLRKEKVATESRLAENANLDPATGLSSEAGGTTSAKATEARRRNNRNPNKRRSVVAPDFTAHVKNKILKRIFDELREVDCQQHSFAAAFLYRAFIEGCTKLYCKQNGIGTDKQELHVLIGKMADKLDKDGVIVGRALKPLRVMANEEHDICSPDTLGAYIHGGLVPNGTDLNKSWDGAEPIFQKLLGILK